MEEEPSLLALKPALTNLLPRSISFTPEALTLQTFKPSKVPPCRTPPNVGL